MKLEAVVWGVGIQFGSTPRGSPTNSQVAKAATNGVARRRPGDGRAGSAANSWDMAAPASATATPASMYRQRYQNGSARAFQSRPWGAMTKMAAHTAAIPTKNRPVRRRKATEQIAPAAASTTSQRRLCGKRFFMYSVSFSQPMLLAYGSRTRNGTDQKAARRAPTPRRVAMNFTRRLPGFRR